MSRHLWHAEALIRLSVAQQLRGLRWYLGLGTCVALLTGGLLLSDDRHAFLGIGLEVSFVVMFSFALAQDHDAGFDDFIASFVNMHAYFACKVVVALILWVAFCLVTFAVAAGLWHEPRLALWGVSHTFLLLAFLIPVALIIETLLDLRYPGVFALAICGAIAMFNIGSEARGKHFFEFTGLDVTVSSFTSLTRLAIVGLVWNAVGFAIATALWIYRHPTPNIRQR